MRIINSRDEPAALRECLAALTGDEIFSVLRQVNGKSTMNRTLDAVAQITEGEARFERMQRRLIA
ncbi:MAG TPA: hypothetical protein VGB05_05570 [Pyrinomonadaceae bacterium]